jgi:hypothetical protein
MWEKELKALMRTRGSMCQIHLLHPLSQGALSQPAQPSSALSQPSLPGQGGFIAIINGAGIRKQLVLPSLSALTPALNLKVGLRCIPVELSKC